MRFLFEIAHAQSQATCVAEGFLAKIYEAVFWPLVVLLSAVALLVFLYGAFRFVSSANNPADRETGRRHMIYGVIGLLVMVSAYAILAIAAGTFGLGFSDPTAPPCNYDDGLGGQRPGDFGDGLRGG